MITKSIIKMLEDTNLFTSSHLPLNLKIWVLFKHLYVPIYIFMNHVPTMILGEDLLVFD